MVEFRAAPALHNTIRIQLEENAVDFDNDCLKLLGQSCHESLDAVNGHVLEPGDTSLSERHGAVRNRARILDSNATAVKAFFRALCIPRLMSKRGHSRRQLMNSLQHAQHLPSSAKSVWHFAAATTAPPPTASPEVRSARRPSPPGAHSVSRVRQSWRSCRPSPSIVSYFCSTRRRECRRSRTGP